jgi:hypothetical protein
VNTFSVGVAAWAKKVSNEIEELRKAVIIELFSSVIMDTPVLTGRLRGNWIISSGVPNTKTVSVTDPSGSVTVRNVESFARGLTVQQNQVFLANNLPYAYRIEYDGWSHTKQPEGMVRKNFIRISQNLKKRYG